MNNIFKILVVILVSCNDNDSRKASYQSSESDVLLEMKLNDDEKKLLKAQTLLYLNYVMGDNLDSIQKYMYEGSIEALIKQNAEITNEEEALNFYKYGCKLFSEKIKKNNIKVDHRIGDVSKLISLKESYFASYPVITILQNKKMTLYDTVQYLGISNDNKKNWKFLNKKEAFAALSFKFNDSEVNNILK